MTQPNATPMFYSMWRGGEQNCGHGHYCYRTKLVVSSYRALLIRTFAFCAYLNRYLGPSRCPDILVVALSADADSKGWCTSMVELQLVSLQLCMECRAAFILHLKVQNTTTCSTVGQCHRARGQRHTCAGLSTAWYHLTVVLPSMRRHPLRHYRA